MTPEEKENIRQVKDRYQIIGFDEKLYAALSNALKAARTNAPVLILGENGVGKENIAKIIHGNSKRKNHPFIAIDCGAIPEGTMSSELFGHKKGAFTGADDNRKGYFEQVNGGTIFLDEIADMPLTTQTSLLRILEYGEFLPVGSSIPQKCDVRIIAATNKNLYQLIADGKFRQDLFHRLFCISVNVPALRERKNDIPLLFAYFAEKVADEYQCAPISLTDEAEEILKDFPWPGNIRELKNVVSRISTLETKRTIDGELLQSYLQYPSLSRLLPSVIQPGHQSDMRYDQDALRQEVTSLRDRLQKLEEHYTATICKIYEWMSGNSPASATDVAPVVPALPAPSASDTAREAPINVEATEVPDMEEAATETVKTDNRSREEFLRDRILAALERNNGNREATAKEVGISTRTLYRKLKEYGH
ncbi:MAG: sigma-54 dependent transcriptional regulator [Bacteroidales bacterium]|nr:sigma-54 dependent transcriptional regulator [Bacteroidales bacterium]